MRDWKKGGAVAEAEVVELLAEWRAMWSGARRAPLAIHRKVWGREDVLIHQPACESAGSGYTLKRMVVHAGFRSSFHKHERKHEAWYVLAGVLLLGSERPTSHTFYDVANEGAVRVIPPGAWHWFGSLTGAVFLEASTADDPEDNVRHQDYMSGALDLSHATDATESTG